MTDTPHALRARRLAIDTYQEHVVYMHRYCPVCRSEGFEAQSRVELSLRGRRIMATLNVVTSDLLRTDDAGLSESAWHALQAREGDLIAIGHAPPLHSLSHVRAKVYGHALGPAAFDAIIIGDQRTPMDGSTQVKLDRVGGGVTPAVLPHHRTCGSASGGS